MSRKQPDAAELRRAAEAYAANIIQHAKEDGIEGLMVMVVMGTPRTPPQYCTNQARPKIPALLHELKKQVETENLVVLPAKGSA